MQWPFATTNGRNRHQTEDIQWQSPLLLLPENADEYMGTKC